MAKQTTKQQSPKNPSPYAFTAAMLATFGTMAAFFVRAIAYHKQAGRIVSNQDGSGFVLTPAGRIHFGNGGPRAAKPADVASMRKSMLTGSPFVSHNGEETKMIPGQVGPFAYRIPAGHLVAGRTDSQAFFSVLLLGPDQ